MKNLTLVTTMASLMVLFSGFARADFFPRPLPRPIRPPAPLMGLTLESEQLAFTLQEIASEARQIAEQARFNRHPLRARNFFDLAYLAENLSHDLSREVVRPLRLGANARAARNGFDCLQPDFRKLNDHYSSLVLVPTSLQLRANKARALHNQINARFSFVR